jgi:hypothetical protein
MGLVGGGSSAAGAALPTPENLPANMVAFVSVVPVSAGRVTKNEFQRALEQSAAAAGRASAPKPGGKGYVELRDEAIGELLDSVWIKGQALEMGIAVTRQQVATELAAIKQANFKDGADYRAFLKQSRFTRQDVNERVELQLLTTRIQERVARGVTGVHQTQEKFKEFVDAYLERWRARTVCAAAFAVDRCSNGPPRTGRSASRR